MYNYYELNYMIKKYLDGGATEADGRASAPVGPSVALQLFITLALPIHHPE